MRRALTTLTTVIATSAATAAHGTHGEPTLGGTGGSTSFKGVFTGTGGPLTTVVDNTGEFNRQTSTGGGTSDLFDVHDINNNGAILFSGVHNHISGLHVVDGSSITTIARESPSSAALNDHGDVALLGTGDSGFVGVHGHRRSLVV